MAVVLLLLSVKKCLVLNMIKIYLFYFYSYKSAINVNAITTNRNASDAVLAPPPEAYGDTIPRPAPLPKSCRLKPQPTQLLRSLKKGGKGRKKRIGYSGS